MSSSWEIFKNSERYVVPVKIVGTTKKGPKIPTHFMAGSVEQVVAKVEEDRGRQPGGWRVPANVHLMHKMIIMIPPSLAA